MTSLKYFEAIDHNTINWEKIESGLNKYLYLMNWYKNTNISTNEQFKKTFRGFYRMRKKYEALFVYLEENKQNINLSFQEVLSYAVEHFQRFECSFSSKLLHTINPNLPIWDSLILKCFDIQQTLNPKTIDNQREIYQKIMDSYQILYENGEAQKLIRLFEEKFPNANITHTKKIDFILWASQSVRDVVNKDKKNKVLKK